MAFWIEAASVKGISIEKRVLTFFLLSRNSCFLDTWFYLNNIQWGGQYCIIKSNRFSSSFCWIEPNPSLWASPILVKTPIVGWIIFQVSSFPRIVKYRLQKSPMCGAHSFAIYSMALLFVSCSFWTADNIIIFMQQLIQPFLDNCFTIAAGYADNRNRKLLAVICCQLL